MAAEARLRVAVFGHAEGRRGDGLSTYSRTLVGGLHARGVDVRFFAHRGDGPNAPAGSTDVAWFDAWRFKTVTIPRPGTMRATRAALAAFAPDVVHISWSFSLHDGAIARAAHAVGAACVATFHLPHGPARTARGHVLQGLYRYQRVRMGAVDRCVALSAEQRRLLVLAGYPPARIVVIPNGVDTAAVTPGPSSLRDELNAERVVLYIGRLDPEKRVRDLIDAFTALDLDERTVLCIAGDGIERERVRRAAARTRNVVVLGLVDRARALDLLRGCEVFVLPSTAEGLALSLLEAMAAGCAIIATDAGDDGVALQDAGVVVPVHPLRPALDGALRTLLADADLRARLGAAARQRAVERYDVARGIDSVVELYRSIARPAAASQRDAAGRATLAG